ncbi:uncharacterized protein A4U43_C08F14870 [Asparagus officinalis]|uniref:NASP-related protein sim3 n=1 Tax=Asparagus officinalis TaxID=4686 RepID=UPI00098E591B|nr:NASP-related protein sim3 [Asparagus officinalis]ONK60146.1 uncharacterized protein A4U43_C08F14870 [Asparagus officinalis]
MASTEEETLTLAGDEQPEAASDAPSTANGAAPASSDPPVEGENADSAAKTLEHAAELFDKGSKAVEEGDFVDAVDFLSRALEIRVAHYGELSPECAIYYYKYGSALLYKSQEEADPLVNVPKSAPKNPDKDKSPKNVEDEGTKASASNAEESNALSRSVEEKDGASEKDQEDDNESSDSDDEESAEADEDESDLDLAWKMLDVARIIVEKSPEDTIEKVNIYAALGEVSLEREDFETSLTDYLKALSISEQLVEPGTRRMVELNFRVCLVLEASAKVQEAIPYCEKAISLCKSRLQQLSDNVKPTALVPTNNVNIADDSSVGDNQASSKVDADGAIGEDEKQVLSGILSELERKLEDLQQILPDPRFIFSEIMKRMSSTLPSSDANFSNKESTSTSLNASQMAVTTGGFDSPTVSTAATNGGGAVTHLGVVGRGVKRASLNPVSAKPLSKKPSLDSSSGVVESTVKDAEIRKE